MRKGQATRAAVLETALSLVSEIGFEALSIGRLAEDVGLSKSGLFAHFGSKERLQIEVLELAVDKFKQTVVVPALRLPRGEPRVRALFENWLVWSTGIDVAGGCVFIAAANELDDRDGPLRDRLVGYQSEWLGGLARGAAIAIEEGHFRPDLDADQFAYEFYSIILAFHHASRLLRDGRSPDRARLAFERLLASSVATGSLDGELGAAGAA